MLSVIKVLFIVMAGIFIVTVLSDSNVLQGFSIVGPTVGGISSPADRGAYTRSYDSNNDGTISDAEYRNGELARIEQETNYLDRQVREVLDDGTPSPYRNKIELQTGNTYAEKRNEEYVTLYADYDNEEAIDITGWKLKSLISGRSATIGEGVRLLEGGRPWFENDDILLAPGDRAYVVTGGVAGISTSFLTNQCTGYLDTRYRFTPALAQSCPLLQDEDLASFGLAFNDFRREKEYDACMDAIENVSSCERGTTDRSLTDACEDFIVDYGSYAGCVKLHKDDPDFYGNEWRIFLNAHRDDLWRSQREAIGLFDKQGLLVDVVRY